jgi:hypothetical protein
MSREQGEWREPAQGKFDTPFAAFALFAAILPFSRNQLRAPPK